MSELSQSYPQIVIEVFPTRYYLLSKEKEKWNWNVRYKTEDSQYWNYSLPYNSHYIMSGTKKTKEKALKKANDVAAICCNDLKYKEEREKYIEQNTLWINYECGV